LPLVERKSPSARGSTSRSASGGSGRRLAVSLPETPIQRRTQAIARLQSSGLFCEFEQNREFERQSNETQDSSSDDDTPLVQQAKEVKQPEKEKDKAEDSEKEKEVKEADKADTEEQAKEVEQPEKEKDKAEQPEQAKEAKPAKEKEAKEMVKDPTPEKADKAKEREAANVFEGIVAQMLLLRQKLRQKLPLRDRTMLMNIISLTCITAGCKRELLPTDVKTMCTSCLQSDVGEVAPRSERMSKTRVGQIRPMIPNHQRQPARIFTETTQRALDKRGASSKRRCLALADVLATEQHILPGANLMVNPFQLVNVPMVGCRYRRLPNAHPWSYESGLWEHPPVCVHVPHI
jgi:hypothetical protein